MQRSISGVRAFVSSHKFSVSLTAFFVLAQTVMIRFHEMWRDELQAWSIARSAGTPLELLQNIRYEGHPPLWHGFLFITTRLTGNPLAMQIIHISVAAATIFLIARYAPFSRLQKIFMSFGYFLFFEYGVIARNYNLTVLLAVIFCILLTRQRKSYLGLGIVLALMAQTNAPGAIMATVFAAYALWDFLSSRPAKTWHVWKPAVLGGTIVAMSLVFFYLITVPPANSGVSPVVSPDVRYGLSTIWQAFVPIPARIATFWNTNIVASINNAVLLSLGCVIAAVLYFARNVKVLVLYIASTSGLFSFFYVKSLGSLRQQGYLFIVFLVCAWLVHEAQARDKRASAGWRRYQSVVLWSVIGLQFMAGMFAVQKDVRITFSRSRDAANYLKANNYHRVPLVGQVDYQTAPLASWLDTEAYLIQSESWSSYVTWAQARYRDVSDKEAISTAKRIAKELKQDVILVAPHKYTGTERGLVLLHAVTDPAIIPDETYFFYRVSQD